MFVAAKEFYWARSMIGLWPGISGTGTKICLMWRWAWIVFVNIRTLVTMCCVTYKTGFELDDWICCTLFTHTQLGTTGNYSAIAILHTLQFTVTHTLGFAVFTSPILATDLSQSHFKSHMKSSTHSLIPFFSLFYNCQSRRFDSIQFLISRQAGISELDYFSLLLRPVFCLCPFVIRRKRTHRKYSLYC
jgi:hypothetical protein